MTAAPPPLLLVEGMVKGFGRREVLKSAWLAARSATVTALVGRNGTGKSTLLRLIVGEIGAEGGTVRFDGRLVRPPRPALLARAGLIYLPTRSILHTGFTLALQLGWAARARDGRGSRSDPPEITSLVEELRLGAFLDRPAHTLSTGESRRAALAVALALEPRCLLLDEPFEGIAPADRDLIAGAVRRRCARGLAAVVTGHEIEDLLVHADEVVWLVAGTTHLLGRPEDALRDHAFRREYLGPRAPRPAAPASQSSPP